LRKAINLEKTSSSAWAGELRGLSSLTSPVQRRRLTRTLRQWRTLAGYSIEAAADELLCGAGTVSRMESGTSSEPLRVKAALELYGAPKDVVSEMVAIAKDRRRRKARPRSYHEFTSPTFAEFLDLEVEATEVWGFESEVVAGLLQTEDYARALISSSGGMLKPEDVTKFVDLRMARQERLTGANALYYRIVLTESTLYNQVGGPAVLREQLRRLAKTARESENIDLRIMPYVAGNCAAFGGNFTIMAFRAASGVEPEAIYMENPLFFVLHDEATELDQAQRIYEGVWQAALDPAASVAMISRAITKLGKSPRSDQS
jgi:hypothetical protein